MTNSYESWIDRQIREAQERGDFDELPGTGKPLPGWGEADGEDWWIKQWVRREEITGVVPETLRIRKAAEELTDTLARQTSEAAVRRIVGALNERIERARRGHVDGPPIVLETFDVERVVREWRQRRRG